MVGDRDVRNHPEFSKLKIRLQVMGSWVVQKASSTTVPDATSGFRAYSAEAAIQLIVVNRYTYTLESLIQAGKMHAAVASVPVGTNAKTRESRLFGSMWGYMRRNAVVITRVFAAYEPLRFFGAIALLLFFGAAMAFVPFFYDWLVNGESDGHLQSIVLGAILALAGVQMLAVAFLADLIASNRMLTQRTLERVRRLELAAGVAPSHYLEIDLSDTDSAPAEGRSGEAPRSGAGSPARSAARDA